MFLQKVSKILANTESFKAKLSGSGLFPVDFGYGEQDEVEVVSVEFEWSYYLDVRNYGIKSLSVIVPDQLFKITFQEADGNEKVQEVSAKHIDVQIERNKDGSNSSLALFPHSIDCYHGRWSISFTC